MPINKRNDEIYSWVDDSGKTHYSNIKKDNNISLPPANKDPLPSQHALGHEKPTPQVIQPPVITPVKAISDGYKSPLGSLVLVIALLMGLRLFFKNIETKQREQRRRARIKNLRPEQNPDKSEIENTLPELPSYTPPNPSWTLEFIRSLEWREFEKLCAKLLETKGFHARLGAVGPDGGIDIHIYKPQELEVPYAIAQCKAQRQEIKVDTVRAFRGVMAAQEITKGYFFTSGGFYKKAWEFGKEQKMELVAGDDLLAEIKSLAQEKQEALLQEVVSTDYATPICVTCGIKMTRRRDPKSDYQFWGCLNYPRCNNKLNLRWTDKRLS